MNPYFKLDLGTAITVQRVEILSSDSESLIGSKIHIGNRGKLPDNCLIKLLDKVYLKLITDVCGTPEFNMLQGHAD